MPPPTSTLHKRLRAVLALDSTETRQQRPEKLLLYLGIISPQTGPRNKPTKLTPIKRTTTTRVSIGRRPNTPAPTSIRTTPSSCHRTKTSRISLYQHHTPSGLTLLHRVGTKVGMSTVYNRSCSLWEINHQHTPPASNRNKSCTNALSTTRCERVLGGSRKQTAYLSPQRTSPSPLTSN